MRFKIGERVGFLNEVGGGIVRAYKTDKIVIVEDETGFDREFLEDDLNAIIGDQSNILDDNFDINDVIEETVTYSEDLGEITKNKDFWEIDLHTHVLLDSERGMTNSQLLNHQLMEFKRFFRKAREKNIRKLVVIHGVGEGVLKSEVRQFLEGKEGVEYYDADFRKYGKGATAIELRYN